MTLQNLQHKKHSREPRKHLVFETFFPFSGKSIPNQISFLVVSGFHVSKMMQWKEDSEHKYWANYL